MRLRSKRGCIWIWILCFWLADAPSLAAQAPEAGEDVLTTPGQLGQRGGRLVASLHSDPKTLNPVTAVDAYSRQIIGLLSADLIHINPFTQRSGAALAKSWKASSD